MSIFSRVAFRSQMLLLMVLMLVFTGSIYTFSAARMRRAEVLRNADGRLLTAARAARHMLPPKYHDQITGPDSVTPEQFARIVDGNNRFCAADGLQYVWSVLVTDPQHIRFTSSTSPDHRVENQRHAGFYDLHNDPDAFHPALAAMKPTFTTFRNEWGWGRMVLAPERDGGGRVFMFGASMGVPQLETVLRRGALDALTMGVGVFLLGGALSFFFARALAAPVRAAVAVAREISEGNLDTPIDLRGSREIELLSRSLVAMRDAIRSRIDALRGSERELAKHRDHLADLVRERTRDLEAANKELESFTYSASHDLRAPLRSMDGFSQAVLEDYGDRLDEAGRDALRRIRGAAQRMAGLIDDLLRLSRIGRTEMHFERVDLGALAAAVADGLRQNEPERSIDLSIGEGLWVDGDAPLLRIMVENLLGNAWKFTAGRERGRIEVGAETRDGKQIFRVRDNGAGFDMTHADRLFLPFQRLHSATEFGGTGIGLAIVHRIVQRHGGTIWADGAVDGGATFYVRI